MQASMPSPVRFLALRAVLVVTILCLVRAAGEAERRQQVSLPGEGNQDPNVPVSIEGNQDPNVPEGEEDFDWSFCNKKFRVITYTRPPFIILDPSKCRKDPLDEKAARLCPPEAFGDKSENPLFEGGGGLTYDLLMQEVVQQLEAYCNPPDGDSPVNVSALSASELVEYQANYKRVQIDWYLSTEHQDSEEGALAMMCNGNWRASDMISPLSSSSPMCPSSKTYQGPSGAGNTSCISALDPGCWSSGPDAAAGAISISLSRLDAYDFTLSYATNKQVVVIRKPLPFEMDLSGYLNIFLPFGPALWLAILCEVLVVWLLILLVEVPVNQGIAGGEDSLYDSFYWSFGSLFDPGGPGKGPVSLGGKLILVAHWFLITIILATYCGALGAFLATGSAKPKVEGFHSLQGGLFGVVVTGPSCNASADSDSDSGCTGSLKGGNAHPDTEATRAFETLQKAMRADSAVRFNIYTTASDSTELASLNASEETRREVARLGRGVCGRKDVVLGAYDYLLCAAGDRVAEPHATVQDLYAAKFELSARKRAEGSCPLVTVGQAFNPSGLGIAFPKNSLYSNAFSRAIQGAIRSGRVLDLQEKYGMDKDECVDEVEEGGDVIGVSQIAGLFVITVGLMGLAMLHAVLTQVLCPYPKGFQVAEYEEEGSAWSEVSEEPLLHHRLVDLRSYAYRVERLSASLTLALQTGEPFGYDPHAATSEDDSGVLLLRSAPHQPERVVGPISELFNLQLPWGL